MKKYYFNGGLYSDGLYPPEYTFRAVHPSNSEIPYITTSEFGIRGAEHHSSVYVLSEDFEYAFMHIDNALPNPLTVKLTDSLKDLLIEAVRLFENSY